ncbi:MAG: hypothetical protein HOW73_37185 [Polyangiaceae bacterium]|nr:hypothetical protein [Polyangiaceae bacterium]
MAYDLAPLKSYVRFYLAILSQLERVWQSLVATETAMRDELGPFATDLAPVPLAAIGTLTDPPRPLPPEIERLWRPEDEAELEALCDVYEVVGRFTFQGEGDSNLALVAKLVDSGRSAARENGEALLALAVLRELAKETGARLRSEEAARAAAERTDKSERLEPMIETVLLRAKQTQEALHAVPLPALDEQESAADEYKKLRAKLQQVYQTCLPFLKNAIDKVWSFVDAPVPQAFPEELPLVEELPAELLSVSVPGSDELEKAERTLAALGDEAGALKRSKEDIAARLVKLEGDVGAVLAKQEESRNDIEFSRALLDWVNTTEQVTAHRARASELEKELASRVSTAAHFVEEARRRATELATEAEKLAERIAALEAFHKELEDTRKKEPLLFGKEEWRKRVAEGDARMEAEQGALNQFAQSHAQHKVELSAAEVRVQTAMAEQAIVERSLADTRARAMESEKGLRALAEKLGTKRPTRPVPAREVEDIVLALEDKQLRIDAELERLRQDQQRMKEDGIRAIARQKQIDLERQHLQARIDSAKVARAEGLEAANRKLAAERKAAVEEHVREVLAALAKSLVQVGTVFVDPARERLREITEPSYVAAERVEAAGVSVAPVVERLLAERAPEIASVEELLGRIQREFCEAAPAACRTAWG